jgi:hypothetical protein
LFLSIIGSVEECTFVAGLSSSSVMDCSNRLYLHNGDNPGSNLVSQLLTRDNYYTWSKSMFKALTTKNAILFINGGLSKPNPSTPDFLPWTRCYNMVLSWILNSISKDIVLSIICVDTAEAMWSCQTLLVGLRMIISFKEHKIIVKIPTDSTMSGTTCFMDWGA